jgi:hypothetical protein
VVVFVVFFSLCVDLADKGGGSGNTTFREPSNLSSWEESDPVSGLVVPILNGDNKVGGAVFAIEDEAVWSLPRLWALEAFMLKLSFQLADSRISCLSFRALLTLRLMDGGNEPLRDIHDGFGVLLVDGKDSCGSAGRDRLGGDGGPNDRRHIDEGWVIADVDRHSRSVGVVVRARVVFAEVGVLANVREVKRGVEAKEEKVA